MTVTVYADLLVFVNLAVNSALLSLTSAFLGVRIKPFRFFSAAFLSSLYGFLICLPSLGFLLTVAFKLASALLVVMIAFGFEGVKPFFKNCALFIALNVAFIGCLMAIRWGGGEAVYINNGQVYLDLPTETVVISSLLVFLAAACVRRWISFGVRRSGIVDCSVTLEGKTVSFPCMLDSGNLLTDPSGFPVILAEVGAVSSLLPKSLTEAVLSKSSADAFVSVGDLARKLRLIPYSTPGGDGLLVAFRPDRVLLGKKEQPALIALSSQKLSDGEFKGVGRDI